MMNVFSGTWDPEDLQNTWDAGRSPGPGRAAAIQQSSSPAASGTSPLTLRTLV